MRWRGIERGRTTFIIRVGKCGKPNAQHYTHSRSSFLAFCIDCSLLLHAIFPNFPSYFCTFLNHCTLTLTHRPPSRISLFFMGIALYIKTCLEPHHIRTTHVPPAGLVSFLSSHYSSSFLLSTCLSLPFWGLLLVLVAVGGALSCLVLASCYLVLTRFKLIDHPFPSSVSSFVVYLSILSFLSLFHFFVSFISYSSTSKRRASLSHTCTTTKFDHSI